MGRITRFGYDAMSRQVSLTNLAIQASLLQQRSYTPDGLLASLTDANNHTTDFAYDGLDRCSTITYPLGSTEGRTYDADNNVLTRTTRAGDTVTFTYDTLNRRISKAAPSEPTVTYAYDLAGRMTGINDNSASIVAAAPPAGSSVQYTTTSAYDSVNRPVSTVWTPASVFTAPSASSVTFNHAYNRVNQRISQTATDQRQPLMAASDCNHSA